MTKPKHGVHAFMKKIAAFIIMMICLATSNALAADYSEAVVDASSGKLHLRAQASQTSDSKGLYFSGTLVKCLSALDNDWVEVQIGQETGYMISQYLKSGEEAAHVEPKAWNGTAASSCEMRTGPSVGFELICKVNKGENVTIWGESVNRWYYVQIGQKFGFVSGSQVRLERDYSVDRESTPSISDALDWKQAYRNWLLVNGEKDRTCRYSLIYVNQDEIPELAMYGIYEATGSYVLTYQQGNIDALQTNRRRFTYIQQENLLNNCDGKHDYYWDRVYTIVKGKWVNIANGTYYDYKDGWNEEQRRYICQTYIFNGKQMSMDSYLQTLDQIYPRYKEMEPMFEYDYDTIMCKLQ